MSKFIKLKGSAYVNGVLRHPHEGVLHLEDDEAKRLTDGDLGEDVTADFNGLDAPIESISVRSGEEPSKRGENPHQADLTAPTKPGSKPAPSGKSKE